MTTKNEPEKKPRLATASLESRSHTYTVRSDGVAFYCDPCSGSSENTCVALSILGSSTSVKAIAAAFQSSGRDDPYIIMSGASPEIGSFVRIRKFAGGYDTKRSQIQCGAFVYYHYVMLARDARLIPSLSESAVWSAIRTDRYTTPVLRHWVPWLMTKMMELPSADPDCRGSKMLQAATCFQLSCAIMHATTEDLDTLVSEGIQSGALKIATPVNGHANGKISANGKASRKRVNSHRKRF